MKYQVFARYNKNDDFGEWQVGTFGILEDTKNYIKRTTERYHDKLGEKDFEMALKKISDKKAEKFNTMLIGLLD